MACGVAPGLKSTSVGLCRAGENHNRSSPGLINGLYERQANVLQTLTSRAAEIFEAGRRDTPGGINSFTRALDPPRVFERAQGAYLYDADGNRFLDYHAAFGP